MARVISTLPNHSTNVNGVAFTADKGQMISDEIADDVAAHFASIPGYQMVKTKAEMKAEADAEKARLAAAAETARLAAVAEA